jgi:hypothetical protein
MQWDTRLHACARLQTALFASDQVSTLHRLLDRTQTVRARAIACVRTFVDTAPRELNDGSAASAARQSLGRALLQRSQRLLRVQELKQQDEVT